MKTAIRDKRIGFGAWVLVALFVLAPRPVDAAVVSLWPDGLVPEQASYDFRHNVDFVSGVGHDSALFFAEIKLPVGSTLTRLQYTHMGYTSAYTWVALYRVKMGGPTQVLAVAVSTDGTTDILPVESPIGAASSEVLRGYRYFVRVYVQNESSTVRGIRVYYKSS